MQFIYYPPGGARATRKWGGEGLPGASPSYQELAEIGEGEGLPGVGRSCQEMAGMKGEKGQP